MNKKYIYIYMNSEKCIMYKRIKLNDDLDGGTASFIESNIYAIPTIKEYFKWGYYQFHLPPLMVEKDDVLHVVCNYHTNLVMLKHFLQHSFW